MKKLLVSLFMALTLIASPVFATEDQGTQSLTETTSLTSTVSYVPMLTLAEAKKQLTVILDGPIMFRRTFEEITKNGLPDALDYSSDHIYATSLQDLMVKHTLVGIAYVEAVMDGHISMETLVKFSETIRPILDTTIAANKWPVTIHF